MMKQYTIFLGVGLLVTILELGSFHILYAILGWGAVVAHMLSYGVGLASSFFFNKRAVFRSKNPMRLEAVKYVVLAGINLVLGSIMIMVLVGILKWNADLAKIIVIGVVSVWNFVIFKYVIFVSDRKDGV